MLGDGNDAGVWAEMGSEALERDKMSGDGKRSVRKKEKRDGNERRRDSHDDKMRRA